MGKTKKKKHGPPPPRRNIKKWLGIGALFLGLAAVLLAAFPIKLGSGPRVQSYTYKVVNRYPHDPSAYTQGLFWANGVFYESTGLRGQSTVRKVEPTTGVVLTSKPLSPAYFGEGLTFFQGVLIQLTWQSRIALVYNSDSLELIRDYRYEHEGWGLTTDGRSLIMSNGTDTLSIRDPLSFEVVRNVKVTDPSGLRVGALNELEYIEGEVWANVYQTFDVLRIAPDSGRVLGRIDFRGILSGRDRNGREDVFNGIAYNPDEKRIFVTGKRYSYVYEVEIKPKR